MPRIVNRDISNRIAGYLGKWKFGREEGLYLHLTSLTATTFSFLVHVLLLFIFAIYGIKEFVVLNIASIAVYIVLFLLYRKRRYTLIAVIMTFEVMLYATFSIYRMGLETDVAGYYILVATLQLVLPYGTPRLRYSMMACVTIVGAAMIGYGLSGKSIAHIPAGMENLLRILNMSVLYIGLISQNAAINIVRGIVAATNENKMKELFAQANTDPLTGLYNRRYAEAYFLQIAGHITEAQYCVAMLDIDDFKLVNDKWGHPTGDQVLRFMARFVREHVRKTDVVFRWGGEEILLVMEGVDVERARAILEKLRQSLEETVIKTARAELRLTVTIGVAELKPSDYRKCIRQCDMRMYEGKQQGKNRVV